MISVKVGRQTWTFDRPEDLAARIKELTEKSTGEPDSFKGIIAFVSLQCLLGSVSLRA